jgi:hypothetical protein
MDSVYSDPESLCNEGLELDLPGIGCHDSMAGKNFALAFSYALESRQQAFGLY